MNRKIFVVLLALGILALFCGCLQQRPAIRVVEKISVQWVENGVDVCRIHQNTEKMHLILNKIRTLGQQFSVDLDPDTLEIPAVTMIFLYSDGSEQAYQIKPDRYIRTGQAPWQQADPKKITSLRLLLLSLPCDLQT